MTELLNGYLIVHISLFAYIPIRATVIIESDIIKSDQSKKWFVKSNVSNILVIENQMNGTSDMFQYESHEIKYDQITKLWKKYDDRCIIEFRLIYNSLAEKNERIKKLEEICQSLLDKDLLDKNSLDKNLKAKIV